MRTNSILDEICAKKRLDLQEEKKLRPFDALLETAQNAPRRADFRAALAKKSALPNVIAELKKASPSRGLIRGDFRPRELAQSLEGAGAAALSVLTETRYFLGSDENLRIVADTVKIPLLCKDFIFDEYQICKAKLLGASAVLLIARMLEPERLSALFAFAKSLSIDALCETHNAEEIAVAADCGADIIGVNCRNLASFETDFSIVEKLLARVPDSAVKVAESAMEGAEMLRKAADCGADAVLVGTALMSKPDPAEALKGMLENAG